MNDLPAVLSEPPPPALTQAEAQKRSVAPSAESLTWPEKATIVLIALGPETASAFLRDLGEDNIRRFARAVSRMREIPHDVVDVVLSNFMETLGDEMSVRGGMDEAKRFLGQVMDGDSVNRILEDLDGRGGRSIWLKLADAADASLAGWLSMEHPQFATVVLTKLRSDQAARVLERFDQNFAQDVVMRMARIPTPDPAAMDQIREVIERDFVSVMERTQGARKPADLIAGLMNHVSSSVRDTMLGHMGEENPRLAQEVQRVMFTFSDIASRVGARDIGKVVKGVEEDVFMTAMKSAMARDDPAVEFILGNVAKRLAERYREDLAAMPDVRRKEGEAAEAEVVAAIQALVKKGEIKLIELDGGDE
ncbi:flagellar motor switch protein FliG [Rhodovulum sp. DZ06]|uniref:flagellar motor switch protein FliG n=1 Tax=Rhodovulum sp. DZ06 TaxID=3425126 RepID=UPI003D32E36D